jgi:hypothetical protein
VIAGAQHGLTIRVPEGMTGDVIVDLNTKRGRSRHDPEVATTSSSIRLRTRALRYAIDLRSMLQTGRLRHGNQPLRGSAAHLIQR